MTIDYILDRIESVIYQTHAIVSPLEMGHCKYCTTWLTLTEWEM